MFLFLEKSHQWQQAHNKQCSCSLPSSAFAGWILAASHRPSRAWGVLIWCPSRERGYCSYGLSSSPFLWSQKLGSRTRSEGEDCLASTRHTLKISTSSSTTGRLSVVSLLVPMENISAVWRARASCCVSALSPMVSLKRRWRKSWAGRLQGWCCFSFAKKEWLYSTGIFTRMAKMKRTDKTKCWPGRKAIRALHHCWWKYKLEPPTSDFSDSSNGSGHPTPRNRLRRNKCLCYQKMWKRKFTVL